MITNKSLKTPLRWPGGKSRAVSKIAPYFPPIQVYKEFREPFLGGGSVSIYVTKQYPQLKIWVNDIYEPLVNFWKQLQASPIELKNKLIQKRTIYNTPDLARGLFFEQREILNDASIQDIDRAVAFFVVNKCCFSGLMEISTYSAQSFTRNFSIQGIEKLPEYSKIIAKWRITNYSYEVLLDGDKNAFVYLDPPYDIKDKLYGKKGRLHKEFNHSEFVATCVSCKMDQIISYNAEQKVVNRFDNWKTAEFAHTYTMRSVGGYMKNQKSRMELLLFNY